MKPGIGLQLAQKDMDRVSRELQVQYSENAQLGANVVPMQVDYAGDAGRGLWVLQIASLFVLPIACSNRPELCGVVCQITREATLSG